MADKIIQLHKANDTSEKWFPNTYTKCVKFQPSDNNASQNKFGFSLNQELNACFDTVYDKIPSVIGIKSNGAANKFMNEKGVFVEVQVQSGSGTVGSGNNGQIAYYVAAGTQVGGCNMFWDSTNNRLGINKTSPTTALDVVGSIYASGGITCAASSSDKRLKTDIKPFSGLDIVNKMNYVQFRWNGNTDKLNGDYDKNNINYGVIAQDVEGVIDGLVFDMPNGYKGVRYEKLIPIMAQAIKELKGEIEELKKQIESRG